MPPVGKIDLSLTLTDTVFQFRKEWRLPSSRSTSLSGDTEVGNESDSDYDNVKGPMGLNLLFSALDPLVDLVFVHGLGGGSRKTWTNFDTPASFWPKEWLSRDADFDRVRAHSFGYDAGWGRKGSVLNIHDFARFLLSSIQNSPEIRKSNVGRLTSMRLTSLTITCRLKLC